MTTGLDRSGLADPAADIRDLVAAASEVPEPPDKIWFQKTAAAVIDADRCVGCGGCIAACPSRSLAIADDGRPTLVRMCTGCSSCWDFCPLAGLRVERLTSDRNGAAEPSELGRIEAAHSARALVPAEGAQDGGVVTALLAALLEAGEIDGAIVTRRRDAFAGEAVLATSAEEIRGAAGSVYEQSYPLRLLTEPLPDGIRRLAMVGTPCQLSVLRALQRFPWQYRRTAAHAVQLTIGLFCTRSFDPVRMMRALAAQGLAPGQVERLDIRDGMLVALGGAGEPLARVPVATLNAAALRGCDECADFGALAADLAVGNLGSAPGFSTVLVRTEQGAAAWARAAGALEIGPLPDLEAVERTARRNRRRAERHLYRGYAPDGRLWVSYSEHLAVYDSTDRAPVSPPPHRSQNYEISC